MESRKEYIKALIKWGVLSLIVGTLCGIIGSAFHIGVSFATGFREEYPFLLYFLPVAGLAIVGIYQLFRLEGQNTNAVISEVHSGKGLKPALLPAIFCSTILTHLCGGSAGREGAALQMGGTIGYSCGKLFRFDDKDLRTATMAGMAAFFAALFGTPLAAAVFAMAVISVGLVYYAALLPCLLSSIAAFWISLLMGVEPTRFHVAIPEMDVLTFIRVGILGMLCAFVTILFCRGIHFTEAFMEKILPNTWLRAFTGGAVIVALTLLLGTRDYNGAGMAIIINAVENGQAVPYAFLLKILFTAITLGAEFKGGEVVPSFFVGATFGCAVGPLLGLPAGFAAALGLVAVFCSAVNCPLASIFLAAELFGGQGLLYFAVVCTLSYVLSGYSGLYSSQKMLYSKIKAQYINISTQK
ncbi:MAG: chloride channel protein [Firmicutes bacterium]|nr:chloride channel protein [Bacillota bacterium]